MEQEILSYLSAECPWRDNLHWYSVIDSTNTQAKAMAREGAPHGTVLIAGSQTSGRGRMGRSFSSPPGMGVYLSVILRPRCPPEQLMHLTCAAAVAMCQAVESVSGVSPSVKWINDLVVKKQKLGGILTELSIDAHTGLTDFAVVGIGINCLQRREDFPENLQDMAVSLSEAAGKPISPAALAAAMIDALVQMDCHLLTAKQQLMDSYRQRCITLNQEIQVIRSDCVRCGRAEALDSSGSLLVRYPDGSCETVFSGEVSVRGMYGYL